MIFRIIGSLAISAKFREKNKKRGKYPNCRHRAQGKSWMSAELLEDWVRELDRKFDSAKSKIALITGNCTAHLHLENLEWIELTFLTANTTSHNQPIDHGVIQALKAKYP